MRWRYLSERDGATSSGGGSQITDDVTQQAIGVRAPLESSRLDHGPVSMHDETPALA